MMFLPSDHLVGEVGIFTHPKRSGQIITTSADVTLNGGLIRELPQNPLNSGLGIPLICPEAVEKLFIKSPFSIQGGPLGSL